MKPICRVSLGILSGLALMASLPSCMVVDPGYVSLSTGYSTDRHTRSYAPSYVTPSYGHSYGSSHGCYTPPVCHAPPVCHGGGW